MSQEDRDERLGLTGLTPEQRRQRVEEMTRELAARHQEAERKLQETRAARPRAIDPDSAEGDQTSSGGV